MHLKEQLESAVYVTLDNLLKPPWVFVCSSVKWEGESKAPAEISSRSNTKWLNFPIKSLEFHQDSVCASAIPYTQKVLILSKEKHQAD